MTKEIKFWKTGMVETQNHRELLNERSLDREGFYNRCVTPQL